MPIINKPPQIVERKYQLEDLVADAAEQYAGWIDSTPDHVVNSAVKMMLSLDKGFRAWRKSQDSSRRNARHTVKKGRATSRSQNLQRSEPNPDSTSREVTTDL